MRVVLIVVYAALAYLVVRALVRWLIQARPKPERRDAGGPADGEMVLDPECGVYVLKDRAVTRIIRGSVLGFCSEKCADAHAAGGER